MSKDEAKRVREIRASVVEVRLPDSQQEIEVRGSQSSDIMTPLWDPKYWSELTEKVVRLKSSVSIMARTVVGLGYDVVVDDKWASAHDHVMARAKAKEMAAELEQMLNASGAREHLRRVKWDEEATGSGYLEVIRAGVHDRRILRICHARATVTRRTKKGMFVQEIVSSQGGKKLRKYFAPFGSASLYDQATGRMIGENDLQAVMEGRIRVATEIIQTQLYSPLDPWYGAPRASGADKDCAVIRQAGRRNSSFLSNDATPRMAVLVSGGDDEDYEEVEKACRVFVRNLREDENMPRILVLGAQSQNPNKTTKVEIKELGATSTDTGFVELSKDSKENIREAFGLAKILYGTADEVNKASALATYKASVETVIWPEQDRWETGILQEIAENFHPAVRIALRRIESADAEEFMQRLTTMANTGAFSINEMRDEAGYPGADDAEGTGFVDMPVALVRIQAPMTPDAVMALTKQLRTRYEEINKARSEMPMHPE